MTEDIDIRFVVCSDGHWGQDSEEFDFVQQHEKALDMIDSIHADHPIDFLVYNGDIVHDDQTLHQTVKDEFFDELPTGVEWYGSFGNHDWAEDDEWEAVYGHPKEHSFEVGQYAFILAPTGSPRTATNESADADYLESKIDFYSGKDGVFLFMHTSPFPRGDWDIDDVGVDDPAVREQCERSEVVATFCGHNHDLNELITHNDARYFYVSRIGGENFDTEQEDIEDNGLRVFDIK